MKNLEALMLDVLFSVSNDILREEFKSCLVSFDWVAKIIIINLFLVVSKELTNGFDAWCALQILGVEHFVNVFFERVCSRKILEVQFLKDSQKSDFETF